MDHPSLLFCKDDDSVVSWMDGNETSVSSGNIHSSLCVWSVQAFFQFSLDVRLKVIRAAG